ncbi:amidohydrolase [Granulicella sp. WH15]|uniref:M20 metallopeptidase family protein n=1 Tax=Granulicella sp. WH15 TaxID=2602070 RepID=UPI0013677B8A|nr:amidohydrolase [Granulicella sp. WH15]QHN04827.1 amidohydrolase [Granulicella sp. WH15]
MRKVVSVALPFLFAAATLAQSSQSNQTASSLAEIYKNLHAHPELSHFEEHTSAFVADELRKAGYTVTDHIGVYPDGSKAYGVVGILKNGPGPTLLIRSDMDALPIIEETGAPYASRVLTKNAVGQQVGVMHACGHDVHMTVFVGTARALAASKANWHGTLMMVGQPSEETGDGSTAMLADHFYERFGVPDMVIGLHDTNEHAAGTVGITSGPAMSGMTSVDVTIHGIGGHGAKPQMGRDPVVLAALFILDLQTIVSREQDPRDPTVVTVGDIHGGTKRNIIPNDVKLELTTRYFNDKARQTTLDGIRQMAIGIATTAGLPPEKFPTVTVLEGDRAPFTVNDPALVTRVRGTLVKTLGQANVFDDKPTMVSEDVSNFATKAPGGRQIPLAFFWLGAMPVDKFAAAAAAGQEMPGLHTSRFQPDPEPTVTTGVKAMTSVALSLLQ